MRSQPARPLPAGADAVVPVENVRQTADAIVVSAPLKPGDYVFLAGDDAKRGDLLAQRGDVVTPGRAALLAAAGHTQVGVHRRPRIAIVCTGDEIVPVAARPGPGQVRNSNATMLAASVLADGGDVVSISAVPDKAGPLRAALERELARCDLLITTGGASVGQRDLVKPTLTSLGARFAFRSIAMRPSKPAAFARVGNTAVAVLPGNPAAAFVGYASLVRGFIRTLAGRTVAFPAAHPGDAARLVAFQARASLPDLRIRRTRRERAHRRSARQSVLVARTDVSRRELPDRAAARRGETRRRRERFDRDS